MKRMKAILSVFLCLLMVWACFAPAAAVGAEGGRELTVTAKAPRLFSGYERPASIDENLPWGAFFQAVDEVLFTEATEVDVSELGIPYTDDNWNFIKNHVANDPKMLRIDDYSISRHVTQTSDIISKVHYSGDSAANAAKRAECEAVIFKLMYGIKDNESLSDYDKCLLLHDRLAAWVEYDKDNYEANTIPADSYTAYGALVNQVAVCEGYSMAYGWMLDLLGIENYYVTSDTLGHGWSKVILNGKAYYVDVTYDDPVYDVPGRVWHKNFLVSSATFIMNHPKMVNGEEVQLTEGEVDFDNDLLNTEFEDSFDKKSRSEIVKIGDAYYYFDHTVSPAKLMKRAPEGDVFNTEEVLTVGTAQTTYSEENEGTTTTTTRPFEPKMTAIGSKIIYTDGKKLFAYDVSAATPAADELFELTEANGKMDGFTEREKGLCILHGLKQVDGKISVVAYHSSNFTAEILENHTIDIDFCTEHTNKMLLEGHPSTTCTQAGNAKYVCPDCRKVWTEATEAGAHYLVCDDSLTVPATCASYGSTTWKCTECDYSEVREGTELAPDAHPENKKVTHAATASTCVTQGYSEGIFCTACNTYISGHALQDLDENNHENAVVTKQAFPATCEADGWTQEVTCLACNTVVSESVTLGKTGHHITTTVFPPTCTTPGYTLRKCSGCPLEERSDYVDPTGHQNTREVAATAGSCIEDAYEAGVYCDDCKTYISGHYSLGKNRNNHVGGWETCSAPATCTKDGYTDANRCLGCGYVDTSVGTVQPALGHTWNEGVEMKKPTCTDTGIRKFTCSTCKTTSVEVIDKLGHTDTDGDEICDRCGKNLNVDACPYCNKIHTGLFAPLVKLFHKIFYLISGPKKAKK